MKKKNLDGAETSPEKPSEEKSEERKEDMGSDGNKEYVEVNLSKLRENPWMPATIVLAIALIVVLVMGGGSGGATVSADEAGQNVVNFVNSQGQGEASLVSAEAEGSLYSVTVNYDGQEIPVYATLDGEFLVSGIIPLGVVEESSGSGSETTTQEIPKSAQPSSELYIWSYCPYGVSALKPFAEVASLLKDSVDFEVVLYHDGHGEFETQENKIQECIQEIAPENYWDYAVRFVEEIYPECSASRDVECDKTEAVKLMKSLGIDSDEVMKCVEERGVGLLEESSTKAGELGVSGSPTLVVNGVRLSSDSRYCSAAEQDAGKCVIHPVARTAEAYKTAICESSTGVITGCEVALSDTAGTTSGNC